MARKSRQIEVSIEDRDAQVLRLARLILDMDDLTTRNSDSLDFKEHSVWGIRNALNLAYEAGFKAAQK